MTWRKHIRTFHRWLSIAFTVTVVIAFLAMARPDPPAWTYYLPLLPLALLLPTGLYLFALPYAARWRRARPETVSGSRT